jgi:hypothetical protein
MRLVLLAGVLVVSATAVAADTSDKLPVDAMFRYRDHNGNLVVSSSLTDEALYAGYQVLDSKGQVVETVPPGIPESERAAIKEKREQARRDQQLLYMYTDPNGAQRTRDRQVEAINLKLSYTKNELAYQKAKLNEQIARAAGFQKQGAPVPGDVTDLITLYSGQVKDSQSTIDQYQADIKAIDEKFATIIQRLEALTGKKVTIDQPASKAGK